MKLPDFVSFEPLNNLRRRMGIPDDVFGDFSIEGTTHRLTADELDRLTSGEGIDVSFDELTVLPDGTLAYKDSRVLLYIRDVHIHGDPDREPRYHVSNCTTLEQMRRSGRFDRYVIATEANGVFKINLIGDAGLRSERRRLSVCQNCLSGLGFDGFDPQWPRSRRREFVGAFAPERFFAFYPQSLHRQRPAFDADTAPINDYTPDFDEVSKRLKEALGWQCQNAGCRRVLDGSLRQYLHTHHRNGDRSDNRRANLKVLCIGCHAEEPLHHHLKRTPQYAAYVRETAYRPTL
jgi:hypothetical protein